MRPTPQPSEPASPATLSNAFLPEPAYLLLAKIQVFPQFLSGSWCSSTPLTPHKPQVTHEPGFIPGCQVLLVPREFALPISTSCPTPLPKGLGLLLAARHLRFEIICLCQRHLFVGKEASPAAETQVEAGWEEPEPREAAWWGCAVGMRSLPSPLFPILQEH